MQNMDYHWQVCPFKDLGNEELYNLLRLRQEVFVVEQNCAYLDLDGLDQKAMHILCWQQKKLIAYARCLAPGQAFPESALGRIVVSPACRGQSLGRELVSRGIELNMALWPDSAIQIGAQAHLDKFYESLGFISTGDSYIEDGIPHVHMIKPLAEG